MVVAGQIFTPITSSLKKEPLAHTMQTLGLFWTWWHREKSLHLPEMKPWSSNL